MSKDVPMNQVFFLSWMRFCGNFCRDSTMGFITIFPHHLRENICWVTFFLPFASFRVADLIDRFFVECAMPWLGSTCGMSHPNYYQSSQITRLISPKWWFSKGNPLISGKSRLVKYYNLASCIVQGILSLKRPWKNWNRKKKKTIK